jgi:hypothetical protein
MSYIHVKPSYCGPGSVVGIETAYGLDGSGIESRWGRDFPAPVQTGPEAHPASCTMGTGSFPGLRCGRGVKLTPHPLLVPRSKNRLELYLYSPIGLSWSMKGPKNVQIAWFLVSEYRKCFCLRFDKVGNPKFQDRTSAREELYDIDRCSEWANLN